MLSIIFTPIFASVARAAIVDLIITNRCTDTIWPAVHTQSGTGPPQSGFELEAGQTQNFTVDTNWNGRVWGRTNCTFDGNGNGHCLTGDCAGVMNCVGTGAASTLAEFNLPGHGGQSYYDISLVDGYNLPVAIEAILDSESPGQPLPNTTNPSCIGGTQGFAQTPFDPYADGQEFLNTSSRVPLPFETQLSSRDVSSWCPRELRIQAAQNGSSVFNPCVSPCDKYKLGIYCCTGKYGTATSCHANYYAVEAKRVCPDAYSYAYDDTTSTFTAPTGSGFEVVFCPGGRSTAIQRILNPSAGNTLSPSLMLLVATAVFMAFTVLG